MQISHVMRRDVVTITADQTLQNAAATMRLFDVGVLPVEEGNKLIGIVTKRDIASVVSRMEWGRMQVPRCDDIRG